LFFESSKEKIDFLNIHIYFYTLNTFYLLLKQQRSLKLNQRLNIDIKHDDALLPRLTISIIGTLTLYFNISVLILIERIKIEKSIPILLKMQSIEYSVLKVSKVDSSSIDTLRAKISPFSHRCH